MPATVPHRPRGIRRQPRPSRRPLVGCFDNLSRVIALASPAFSFTFGLLVTFLGIGVIANVLIAYAVVQVLGERQQNEEHRSQLDA
jgi:hypothetical protein